ncbi:MAG: 4-(cytidine 5'-diphospho)-2-C-methyl-D-erythritol kinase [Firmicutes bacterium]|nr:4-(cytidine 5'-diphospho)-2-C-methyl-D-erythritol kinase [Bacillota bacterium]
MKHAYRAYAKINLLLDVTGKLPNGYHSVAMIMQSIDLHDTVTVEAAGRPGVGIACDLPYIPTDRRNIAWKACEAFGVTDGLNITLEKRIPSQAGLGGGSADAAAVLTALRDMFKPGMPDGELLAIGAKVGADVPFCLTGGCCLAEGIGELLTSLPCLPDGYEIEVLKPSAGVNTAKAYAALDTIALRRPQTAQAVGYARQSDWESLFPLCENVFEQVARLPGLAEYRRGRLEHGALLARMTGSGSAVYSIWRAGTMPAALQAPMVCEGSFICKPTQFGVEEI